MRNCPVLLIAKRKTSKRESQTRTYKCVHGTWVKRDSTYISRQKYTFLSADTSSIAQASETDDEERKSKLLGEDNEKIEYSSVFFNIFNEEFSSLETQAHCIAHIPTISRKRKYKNDRFSPPVISI